ncbi:hypothetical protein T492DRAFT_970221, partial [Pavlovales sp. CCMP2436]
MEGRTSALPPRRGPPNPKVTATLPPNPRGTLLPPRQATWRRCRVLGGLPRPRRRAGRGLSPHQPNGAPRPRGPLRPRRKTTSPWPPSGVLHLCGRSRSTGWPGRSWPPPRRTSLTSSRSSRACRRRPSPRGRASNRCSCVSWRSAGGGRTRSPSGGTWPPPSPARRM